jgi:hypothetical protein
MKLIVEIKHIPRIKQGGDKAEELLQIITDCVFVFYVWDSVAHNSSPIFITSPSMFLRPF